MNLRIKSRSALLVISLIVIATALSLLTNCLMEEDEDQCAQTKWIEPKEPMVYLKFSLKQFSIENQYNSHAAQDAIIQVVITKFYCPDKQSTMFTRTQTIHPDQCDPQYLEQGFYLEQPYQFKFENDLDYLEVYLYFSLYFPERYKWQDTIVAFYPNLIYDYNLNSYYIPITIEDWYPK